MTQQTVYRKERGVNPSDYTADYVGPKYEYINGTLSLESTSTYHRSGLFYAETRGVRLKDFHKRRRAGELLPHTYFQQYTVEGTFEGEYDITWDPAHTTKRTYVPNWRGTAPIDERSTSLADLLALAEDVDYSYELQRAASNIAFSGHDTLTFLAEIHKVRTLFSGTLKKAVSIASNITDIYDKGRSIGRYKNILDAISGLWLEQRYGYRTLLFDMIEIERVLSDLQHGVVQRISERQGSTSTQLSTWTSATGGSAVQADQHHVREDEISVRGSITADIVLENFHTNVVNTAWELVPYSFVIDWFWNVGKAIGAMSFLSFAQKYSSSGGLKITSRVTSTTEITGYGSNWSGNYSHNSEFVSTLNLRKPIPVRYHPLWRIRLDEWKVLDLLALLSKYAIRR